MALVDIIEPDLFVLNMSKAQDVPLMVRFSYRVAERVGQTPYVAAFAIDGRALGGPPLEGPRDRAAVHVGREDAIDVKRFDGGKSIVVWLPPTEEWTCELIGRHWDHHAHICWGVFVDSRTLDDVGRNLQATWPRRHAFGDHSDLLESTVGNDRKMVMLSYDSCWFSGKASADCWDVVVSLLTDLSEGDLEVYPDADDDQS